MTSKLFKTITDKYLATSDDETDDRKDNSADSSAESDSESSANHKSSQSEQPVSQSGAGKQTFRGNVAALLDMDDTDDDDDDDGPGLFGGRTGSKTNAAVTKVGIYGKKIASTKNHVKVINNDFVSVEKGLMTEIENETRAKVEKDDACSGPKKFKNADSSDEESEDEESLGDKRVTRASRADQKAIEEQENIERELSPPPPPQITTSKPKRKSTTIAEKHLRELEMLKLKTMKKTADENPNVSTVSGNFEDLSEMVTVRVSTKTGVHKWDLNENDTFQSIFEKVAVLENKDMDSFLLTVNDRIIKFNDTPAGIKLRSYDIIDFVQNAKKPQERIRVVEQDQDIDELTNGNSNMLTITLQTQEGRKSRVTFLVFKDEKFVNILKKYCEKRGLDNYDQYMIEFDGDKVEDDETPSGLDLDGGEIFDVKKSSKTTLQLVNENKDKYDFDDDILIA